MSTKIDPHHLVALMNYAFKDKQDGSPRRLDPKPHTVTEGIVNDPEINVRTFHILDALAHISVSREKGQVVAIGLQFNPGKKEIRITVAENTDVTAGLVNHLTLVWRKLQSLSVRYQEERSRSCDKPGSPEMPQVVHHSLRTEIFRNIYRYSLEKQMKRIDKWFNGLGRFVKELVKWRLPYEVQEFELSLCNAVIALSMAVRVVSKLRDNPTGQLTESEWESVHFQSILANKHVRIVLADRNGLGCEILAGKLGGMLLLLPHYRTYIHTPSKYTLTTNWSNVCTGSLFYKPISGDCVLGQVV